MAEHENNSELTVRVIVEQPVASDQPPHGDSTISDLAAIVLRLTQVTERLAVVDDGDVAIVRKIESFDERISGLEERVKKLEELFSYREKDTPAPAINDLAEIEQRLEAKLAGLIKVALGDSALQPKATSLAVPAPGEAMTEPETSQAETSPVVEAVNDTPDYMIENTELKPTDSIKERIILFLLAQPDQTYRSPKNTAAADIADKLAVFKKDIYNSLTWLEGSGMIEKEKKGNLRTSAIQLQLHELDMPQRFLSERVSARLQQIRQAIADEPTAEPPPFLAPTQTF